MTSVAQRLPQTVLPTRYELTITPNLAAETFHGEETIDVVVRETTSTVKLHAVDLVVHDARVNNVPATVTVNPADETITLTTPNPTPAGEGSIVLRFDGKIGQQLRGLYIAHAGNRKYAVTQFESTDARRAFPCFDEPAMKAKFDIRVVVDKGDTAISNGRITGYEPVSKTQMKLYFATTRRISTYLVAILVGDFDCISGEADNIPIRVCGPPGRAAKLGAFALSAAEQSIRFYDQYYGIKYPFQKLDMIAIPDFEAGAMENAGAITYRESAIFFDPKVSAYARQKSIANTVAHEIAHQWFGDLVTMSWWDDIWLNEGFATFMSTKPIAPWKPEWNTPLTETSESRASLAIDSQNATRPIRTPAETPEEIDQLFDGIAYGKTAAVLRMLEQWLGEDTFREGIRTYLKNYSWSNATAEDLWGTLAAVSKKPVDVVMKSFVDQPGAPLLHAQTECKDGKGVVQLSQERVRMRDSAANEQLWNIPFCAPANPCAIVGSRTATVEESTCDPSSLNANGRGYYVTDYATADRMALRTRLAKLNEEERIALEADEWLLVVTLRREIAEYLELVRVMPRPASRQLVETITAHLMTINEELVTEPMRAAWQREVRSLMQGFAPFTWQAPAGENAEQLSMRANVLWTVGYIGQDPNVIAGAKTVAGQYLSNPSSVDVTVAAAALDIAAINGDAALYRRVREALSSAQTADMHDKFATMLTEFRDPKLIGETLKYTYGDAVRSQDLPRMIARAFDNPAAREAAWRAVTQHWPELQKSIPTALHNVTGGLKTFCDANSKQAIEAFFASHPPREGSRSLRRSLESVDTCIAFRGAQEASLQQALGK